MKIPKDTYKATVVGAENYDVSAYIDVKPPFTPDKDFLDECGFPFGTELKHFVTTPNTTRLGMNICDEADVRARIASFEATAQYLARVLSFVDRGVDPFMIEPDDLLNA